MKKSEFLKLVRTRLNAGATNNIFSAIWGTRDMLIDNGNRATRVSNQIESWVESLIPGCYGLRHWVAYEGHAKRLGLHLLPLSKYDRYMRRLHYKWLTWMIQYWEGQGQ